MWVSKLKLNNIKGFEGNHEVDFSKKINILTGPNNSGKSTILNSIFLFQKNVFEPSDITLNKTLGRIDLSFEEPNQKLLPKQNLSILDTSHQRTLALELNSHGSVNQKRILRQNSNDLINGLSIGDSSSVEPNNLIYPYLSRRKVGGYSEEINSSTSNSVKGNFENLYAKIDRLSNPYFVPGYNEYQEACKNIIGFPITTIASPNGKRAALIVKNLYHIPLTSMGEGVANLLGLIVDLCMAENHIFIIEELENDIHPKALKALLELIEKKSENNQFFISTHSNIVTKYLGSLRASKIFSVKMNFAEDSLMPNSSISEIENTKEGRQKILEDLGYEFHDYELWKAWLFLEESSCELIIREYLIPMFIPSLAKKLRTFSARTASEIESKFKDFNNLFVFLHLDPIYKNKAWVVLDHGVNEEQIITKMKDYYVKNGWNESNFLQFSEHDFERYYPAHFSTKASSILEIKDRKEKKKQKELLLEELKIWTLENWDEAKNQFKTSAKEIIDFLKLIDKSTNS